MGITRSSKVKRRATGGRMPIHRKKRKFEMGRQPSMTKLGEQKVVNVRGRDINIELLDYQKVTLCGYQKESQESAKSLKFYIMPVITN